LSGSCSQFGVANNSPTEIQDLQNAIVQVASESGIDARYILAVVLQESSGCVRAPTTNYGVRNPGLMQSHNGAGTCNDQGQVLNPCPSSQILQMVRDGVQGTASGDGLAQLLAQAPGNSNSKYYAAARMYNSGSIASTGVLEQGIATHCYASNIANRLLGWINAKSTCTLDGATAAAASPVSEAETDFGTVVSETTPSASPSLISYPTATVVAVLPDEIHEEVAVPSPVAKATPALPSPMPTVETTSKDSTAEAAPVAALSSKRAPGVTESCAKYYRIESGDVCDSVASKNGVSFAVMRTLNTDLDASCSNLWLGYDYCVQALS
jgi:hypothetical protein